MIENAKDLQEQRTEEFERVVDDFRSTLDDSSDLALLELVQTVQPQLEAASASCRRVSATVVAVQIDSAVRDER